jgi:hypothetical protein
VRVDEVLEEEVDEIVEVVEEMEGVCWVRGGMGVRWGAGDVLVCTGIGALWEFWRCGRGGCERGRSCVGG